MWSFFASRVLGVSPHRIILDPRDLRAQLEDEMRMILYAMWLARGVKPSTVAQYVSMTRTMLLERMNQDPFTNPIMSWIVVGGTSPSRKRICDCTSTETIFSQCLAPKREDSNY